MSDIPDPNNMPFFLVPNNVREELIINESAPVIVGTFVDSNTELFTLNLDISYLRACL